MDERLLKTLVKSMGINLDDLLEHGKVFVESVKTRLDAQDERLQRIESKLDCLLTGDNTCQITKMN